MIISRTPFRISFFGGGSDYPTWSRENGGAVLVTTIDKYCHLSCRYLPPFFDYRFRILYSKIENVQRIEQIEHPAVRCALQEMKIRRGVEIHHDGDLPARSGMGSSSSFAVGILHVLHALKGRQCSKEQLAKEAIHLEQNVLNETVGNQDQVAAAYGGFNTIRFLRDGQFSVQPALLPKARLDEFKNHLMLFFTGVSRTSSEIASTFVGSLKQKEKAIHRFVSMVDIAIDLISNGRIEDIGPLLDEAWKIKRSLSPAVSTPAVDEVYTKAIKAGALGGKLLGAGGGGFLLIFTLPERRKQIQKVLSHCLHVPFNFESSGSQIVLYNP